MDAHLEETINLEKEVNNTTKCVQDTEHTPVKVQWSNKFQYTLTLLGYSVGLGNLWRFPYICQRNGGGAFLLPYVIFILILAMPLFFLELTLGQFSRQGPIKAWGLCPLMQGVGYSMLVINFVTTPYYSMVFAWALYYLYRSFSPVLPWTTCGNTWNTLKCVSFGQAERAINMTVYNATMDMTDNTSLTVSSSDRSVNTSRGHTSTEEFWQYGVLGVSSGLEDVGLLQPHLLLCWFLACAIIFLCVMKGIRSIGKVVYVTAVLPYFLLTVLLVRSCMMPGALDGILYYLTPDFSRLRHPQVWLEALVQVFFSTGPSWGSLIVMASHNQPHNNIAWDSVIVVSLGELTSIYAGFVVFSTVGYLAQSVHLPVADVITSGPGIAFIVYPEAVSLLPVSQLWSVLFFLALLMMGLDTVFGNIEAAVGCMEDLLPRRYHGRHLPTILAAAFMLYLFAGGIVFTTNGGVYIFQLMDWYAATYTCFIIALSECLVVGWMYGIRRFTSDVQFMIGKRPPVIFKILCCLVIPAILLVVLVLALVAYKPPSYGDYKYPQYAAAIGWCFAVVSVLPIPVTMVVMVLRAKGSLHQRLRRSMTPNKEWQKLRNRHDVENEVKSTSVMDNFRFIFTR